MSHYMPWIIGGCVVLLLLWVAYDHGKLAFDDGYDKGDAEAHAELDRFLADWSENEDAQNHTT